MRKYEAKKDVGFFVENNLLYRRWVPRGCDNEEVTVEQLVFPDQCRKTALRLAHSIPLAGHLGRDKTTKRLLQRFYWFSIHKDVAEYCRECDAYQRVR